MDTGPTIVLPIDPRHPGRKPIATAADALVRGELVILPTETVYGVAADPRVAGALQRIYQAKGRPENKPIPLLGPDLSSIEEYGAELPPAARALAHRFWPGPLTLVLAAPEGEVGFRVPDHAVARALLRRAGSLLAVTSANRSGDPPAGNAQDAVAAIGNWVAVALDAGPAPGGVPSTVVRAIGGNIEILRAGAIPEQEIRAAE